MSYTIHGHHIPGSPDEGFKVTNIARCGGPGLCKLCSNDAANYYNSQKGNKMQIEKYTRKPFEIDAVRVTEENFKEVANWCQGEIREEGDRRFIKVRTHHPLSPRQTMAYVGDWVLYANNGYKVYTQKAFNKSFEKKDAPARGPVFQELAQREDVRIEQAVKTVQEVIPGSTVISEEQTPGEKFRGEH